MFNRALPVVRDSHSELYSLVANRRNVVVMIENIASSGPMEIAPDTDGYIKRKQKYVKRQFQQSMMLQAILITFTIVNVIIMAIFWAIDSFSDLHQFKVYLAFTIASLEVIGFIASYKLNLEASHRIAGPIFSFERCLNNVEFGDLTSRSRLRKTDQFPETAEQLNITINSVRIRINNAQYLAEQIQQHPEHAGEYSQQLVEELAFFNTTDFNEARR